MAKHREPSSKRSQDGDDDGGRRFTIPKKKSEVKPLGKVTTDSREFLHDILPIIKKNSWSNEYASRFAFSDAHLINNQSLLKNFEEKRRDFKRQGYSDKEQSVSYGFLNAFSEAEVEAIANQGLLCGHSIVGTLGKLEMGVCLSRYSDVISPAPLSAGVSSGFLVMFKVLKGKAKGVPTNSSQLEPSPQFDCHISKEPQSQLSIKTAPDQLFYALQMYLYEYVDGEIAECPRNVLPFAVVRYSFGDSTTELRTIRQPLRPPAKFRTLWTGELKIQGSSSRGIGIQLQANFATLKPFGLGKCIVVTKLVPFEAAARWDPIKDLVTLSSTGALLKKREVKMSCGDYAFYCKLVSTSASAPQLGELAHGLLESKTVGLSGLRGGTMVLIMPASEFTVSLGIPLSTEEEKTTVHCCFISYRSITSGFGATSNMFDTHTSENIPAGFVVTKTQLLDCFKQLQSLKDKKIPAVPLLVSGTDVAQRVQVASANQPLEDESFLTRLTADPRVRKRLDNVLGQCIVSESPPKDVCQPEPGNDLVTIVPAEKPEEPLSSNLGDDALSAEMEKPYDPADAWVSEDNRPLNLSPSISTDYSYLDLDSVVSLRSSKLQMLRHLQQNQLIPNDALSDITFITTSDTPSSPTREPVDIPLHSAPLIVPLEDRRELNEPESSRLIPLEGSSLTDVDLRLNYKSDLSPQKAQKEPNRPAAGPLLLPPEFGCKDVDLRSANPTVPQRHSVVSPVDNFPPGEREPTGRKRLGQDYFREQPGRAWIPPPPPLPARVIDESDRPSPSHGSSRYVKPEQEPIVSSTTQDSAQVDKRPFSPLLSPSAGAVCRQLDPTLEDRVYEWLKKSDPFIRLANVEYDIDITHPVREDLEHVVQYPAEVTNQHEPEHIIDLVSSIKSGSPSGRDVNIGGDLCLQGAEGGLIQLLEENERESCGQDAYDPEVGITPLEFATIAAKNSAERHTLPALTLSRRIALLGGSSDDDVVNAGFGTNNFEIPDGHVSALTPLPVDVNVTGDKCIDLVKIPLLCEDETFELRALCPPPAEEQLVDVKSLTVHTDELKVNIIDESPQPMSVSEAEEYQQEALKGPVSKEYDRQLNISVSEACHQTLSLSIIEESQPQLNNSVSEECQPHLNVTVPVISDDYETVNAPNLLPDGTGADNIIWEEAIGHVDHTDLLQVQDNLTISSPEPLTRICDFPGLPFKPNEAAENDKSPRELLSTPSSPQQISSAANVDETVETDAPAAPRASPSADVNDAVKPDVPSTPPPAVEEFVDIMDPADDVDDEISFDDVQPLEEEVELETKNVNPPVEELGVEVEPTEIADGFAASIPATPEPVEPVSTVEETLHSRKETTSPVVPVASNGKSVDSVPELEIPTDVYPDLTVQEQFAQTLENIRSRLLPSNGTLPKLRSREQFSMKRKLSEISGQVIDGSRENKALKHLIVANRGNFCKRVAGLCSASRKNVSRGSLVNAVRDSAHVNFERVASDILQSSRYTPKVFPRLKACKSYQKRTNACVKLLDRKLQKIISVWCSRRQALHPVCERRAILPRLSQIACDRIKKCVSSRHKNKSIADRLVTFCAGNKARCAITDCVLNSDTVAYLSPLVSVNKTLPSRPQSQLARIREQALDDFTYQLQTVTKKLCAGLELPLFRCRSFWSYGFEKVSQNSSQQQLSNSFLDAESLQNGILVPDDRVLQSADPDEVETILLSFEAWKNKNMALWHMKLHSQVVLQLAEMKKNLQPDSTPHIRAAKLLVLLTKFRKSGIVILLPKHACDASPRPTIEYLPCVENLKQEHYNPDLCCVVLSNLSKDSDNAKEFSRRNINVMNIKAFLDALKYVV